MTGNSPGRRFLPLAIALALALIAIGLALDRTALPHRAPAAIVVADGSFIDPNGR